MLEALVAFGLAGNIVQFVQYAGELISQANDIRKKGGPSSLHDLRKLTDTLTKQASIIQSHLLAPNGVHPQIASKKNVSNEHNGLGQQTASGQPRSQEDQHLLDIASDCRKAGDEFLAYLDALIDRTAKPNVLRSVQKSIKFKWAHHKIENFASKLDQFRSVLSLATILALRAKTDAHNQAILSHMQALKAEGAGQAAQGVESTKALQALVDIIQSQSGPKLDEIQSQIQQCLGKVESLRKEVPQTKENDIMKWLNFRQMSWRYEEVPLAFQQTFQWIFQQSREDPWDNFADHLTKENVTVPYWINGKAGSGKSTLMKFIVNDPRTEEALRIWADGEQLLVLNFFFWNLGTLLQKSNVGMLRSLIYSVLEKYPELIPAVFPDLYRNWKVDFNQNSEPSYIEIKKAFTLLLEKSSSFLKLCIFIDGIDEFEGDHKDTSTFLSSLASDRVKIVVSSRPISACVSVFRTYPTLRLQDLTKHDMDIFVKGNLSSHWSMVDLTRRFPREANELVQEIKTKAAGVFLWVKIVVRMLVDGLEEGDEMKDLQKKLRQLPPDLRDLYRRMIGRMLPDHQTQAAQIFQTFHTWNLTIDHQPFKTLALAFSMQPLSEAFDRQVAPLEAETRQWLCHNTEARIRSRCCGLIEVHSHVKSKSSKEDTIRPSKIENTPTEDSDYAISDVDVNSTIDYLHRTVGEFLASVDVWKEISDMTKGTEFDPYWSLTSSCLSLLKTDLSYTSTFLLQNLQNCVTFSRRAPTISDHDIGKIFNAIDGTMHLYRQKFFESGRGGDDVLEKSHWSTSFFKVKTVLPFREGHFNEFGSASIVAARLGLCRYLKAFYDFRTIDSFSKYCVVLHALESWRDTFEDIPDSRCIPWQDWTDTLLFLLQNAAWLEDQALDDSLWQNAVMVCKRFIDGGDHVKGAEVMRICLTTLHSRARYSLKTTTYRVDNKFETVHPVSIIQKIKLADEGLGNELERLAFPEGPVYALLQSFMDTEPAISAQSLSTVQSNLMHTEAMKLSEQSSARRTEHISSFTPTSQAAGFYDIAYSDAGTAQWLDVKPQTNYTLYEGPGAEYREHQQKTNIRRRDNPNNNSNVYPKPLHSLHNTRDSSYTSHSQPNGFQPQTQPPPQHPNHGNLNIPTTIQDPPDIRITFQTMVVCHIRVLTHGGQFLHVKYKYIQNPILRVTRTGRDIRQPLYLIWLPYIILGINNLRTLLILLILILYGTSNTAATELRTQVSFQLETLLILRIGLVAKSRPVVEHAEMTKVQLLVAKFKLDSYMAHSP
ncbi:hypothetical protein G7Y89_g13181 [Cudoniella acicularis]|uniref:NACHT domain-containing protein n=1 Tax=Cudoniella acicularis TaxID=354080 RepID=A0A8H4VYY5_9HELO|nr:hypothetical protein G7Y89_g13181 [Cudoniella acicularis]